MVDAKLLKELLPEEAAGLARKSAESEKVGAIAGALMGMAAWSMIDMDKETENGYEKTTTYKGNKAYEKYNSKNRDGEMAVIVAKRFVVTVKGRDVEMDKIKETFDDIDLGKLADLE